MADLNPISLWRRLLALPNESRTKTIAVAFLVSLFSALLVSGAAVTLKPIQEANRAAERQARMDAMIAALPGLAEILKTSGADTLETRIIDLDTGLEAEGVDPASFDARAAASDPQTSIALLPDIDIAGIGRRGNLAQIHILKDGDDLSLVILPVSAAGYASTIHAYLALEGDLNTVAALTITEQRETPGLGARIEEAAWQALWPGKQIADANGEIRLAVVRGGAVSEYEVDGITGATRTGNAVTNMIGFWMGEHGYGPLLDNLRAGRL
ncbi:MAG: NADH:ubiquinone reductase (Na(+)-transporting) subunit C [Devosia sp.]|nr:NADH:ubiquinone reductase (Na(+)-transporting) subunit C [Devosia sp.]